MNSNWQIEKTYAAILAGGGDHDGGSPRSQRGEAALRAHVKPEGRGPAVIWRLYEGYFFFLFLLCFSMTEVAAIPLRERRQWLGKQFVYASR
jgi:hypothetical protein